MAALATAGVVDSEALGHARARPAPTLGADTLHPDPFPDPRHAFEASRERHGSTLIPGGALAAAHDAASGSDRSGGVA